MLCGNYFLYLYIIICFIYDFLIWCNLPLHLHNSACALCWLHALNVLCRCLYPFMIPNNLDKFVSNTNVEHHQHPPVPAHSRFFKLTGKFNSRDAHTRAKATQPPSSIRSTSSSFIFNPNLPPPGPAHYAARRALWLTPTKVPRRSPPSSSRQRLEQILNQPGAVNNEEAWKGGIEKVWKGLVNGGRLKRSLPLSLVVRSEQAQNTLLSAYLYSFSVQD